MNKSRSHLPASPPLPRLQDPCFFALHDLKRARALAGTLFNVLFNLSKFMAYETRDPFVSRQVGGGMGGVRGAARGAVHCDWKGAARSGVPACCCCAERS